MQFVLGMFFCETCDCVCWNVGVNFVITLLLTTVLLVLFVSVAENGCYLLRHSDSFIQMLLDWFYL